VQSVYITFCVQQISYCFLNPFRPKVAKNSMLCLDNTEHQNFVLWNESFFFINLQESMVRLVLSLVMTNFISMRAT